MNSKFEKLGVDNAPGQEANLFHDDNQFQYNGDVVDFSHGNVDAFKPLPNTLEEFIKGVELGAEQAYTEYKGKAMIRENLCQKLSSFVGVEISHEREFIITPGSQGALFLAMASIIEKGMKVAIITPDYFANRKIAEFFEADIVNIPLDYLSTSNEAGIDLITLEEAFQSGVELFVFSNPNNPTGVVYAPHEIQQIISLSKKYSVTLIVDQLYSRQVFDGRKYTHLCSLLSELTNVITIMGPSKTESLSGYRLGVAFGSQNIISRMEKLQAIVSLRASGYNQHVLNLWFNEPKGWMDKRIKDHQVIRDELINIFQQVDGVELRKTEAGSYLFVTVPKLKVSMTDFIRILRIQEGVIVTIGTEFGSMYTNSFRLNFSQDILDAKDAVTRIVKAIKRYT